MRMLRIFIAGRSTMRGQISHCITRLREFGHFGYDWTKDPGWDAPDRYHPLTVANRDLAEVTLADGVIWMIDEMPSHGAPYEVGYADRGGQPIVVLWGKESDQTGPLTRLLYAYRHPFAFDLDAAVHELERMVEAREKESPFGVTANRLREVEQKAAHAVTMLHEYSEAFSRKLNELAEFAKLLPSMPGTIAARMETLPSGCKLYFGIKDSQGVDRGCVEFWPGKPLGEQFAAEVNEPNGVRSINHYPHTPLGFFPSLQCATEAILMRISAERELSK